MKMCFHSTNSLIPGWAGHHAPIERGPPMFPGINSLAPLLKDKVNTYPMQAHCMMINKMTVEALNPGQTPVDHCDCPVYALTRTLQFRFPDLFSK